MEWVLFGLITILLAGSLVILFQIKKTKEQTNEATYGMMNEFVSNLEKENDELYNKMLAYIKVNESNLEERIKTLEEKINNQEAISENKKTSNHEQREKITQMHKQGFSSNQIAKILQVNKGKVEFIINMYTKSKAIK